MRNMDAVEIWLKNVAASHSGSRHTTYTYRRRFREFCQYLETTPSEILKDYDQLSEKIFKHKYTTLLRTWIAWLYKQAWAPNTILHRVTAVKSFFKYSDLPLGFIPVNQVRVIYHNRDITKDEITQILGASNPREKAFYTMMAQTGLRPDTLTKLRLKHIEPDFSDGVIPCKVEVPQELAKGKYQGYFTFMGQESVKALKDYFSARPDMTKDNLIFVVYGDTEGQTDRQTFTNSFRKTLEKLKKKGLIDYEKKPGKPAELRLYNLRKWFKKHTHEAGEEFSEFWMGHKGKGVVDHYRTRDPEFHRKLYAEKAMPFLRLEGATPTQTDKVIAEQQKEIEDLRETVKQLQQVTPDVKAWMENMNRQLEEKMVRLEELAKYLKSKYPEDFEEFEKRARED